YNPERPQTARTTGDHFGPNPSGSDRDAQLNSLNSWQKIRQDKGFSMKIWGGIVAFCLVGLIILTVLNVRAADTPNEVGALNTSVAQSPIAIAEQGTFYAGGHYDDTHPE